MSKVHGEDCIARTIASVSTLRSTITRISLLFSGVKSESSGNGPAKAVAFVASGATKKKRQEANMVSSQG